ncbi:MAG TPA: ABC transporter ATP-binding protein [Mycobacteriales bacterium]|nr:ABC transporter ATP-binding protein [Mycobacteriales bacterium]
MIRLTAVSVDLGRRPVLRDVSLTVGRGEWVTVVGANGAGKSTLLRFVSGLVRGRGDLALDGRDADSLRHRDRARLVALVPQSPIVPDGIRVVDYVLLGRTPHLGPLGAEGPGDLACVHESLERLDLVPFAQRAVTTLSGGERQRVLIARALAQQAPIVLLDEPTTSLDVGHQQQVLELVDTLRRDHDLTVVTTMHDLTLAGQYADRVVLLDDGQVVVDGSAAEVLTEANLLRYYGARVRVVRHDTGVAVLPLRPPSTSASAVG